MIATLRNDPYVRVTWLCKPWGRNTLPPIW